MEQQQRYRVTNSLIISLLVKFHVANVTTTNDDEKMMVVIGQAGA